MQKRTALLLAQHAIAYADEADSLSWARSIGPHTFRYIKCKTFLERYCWVVYASGFRARILQTRFAMIALAFKNFDVHALSRMRSINPVLKAFGNRRKAEGFLRGAKLIANEGFIAFKKRVQQNPTDTLEELPGIGPITKYHLAKNIGILDVAKPDIWLVRAAELCNASSVEQMIAYQSRELNETRHTIDVAIWVYAEAGHLYSVAR